MAGILPRIRWTASVFYAVTTDAMHDIEAGHEWKRAKGRDGDQRPKVGLVAVKRLGAASPWLIAMGFKIQARIMWLKEKPAERGIISDASPMGIGAVLWRKDKETGRSLRRSRLSHGEAASQAVREAYASLRAVLAEAHSAQGLAMILKSDSSVALGIAQKLSSPSPSLNYIAAELALLLDTIDAKQIELYHVLGNARRGGGRGRGRIGFGFRRARIVRYRVRRARWRVTAMTALAAQEGDDPSNGAPLLRRVVRPLHRSSQGEETAGDMEERARVETSVEEELKPTTKEGRTGDHYYIRYGEVKKSASASAGESRENFGRQGSARLDASGDGRRSLVDIQSERNKGALREDEEARRSAISDVGAGKQGPRR